MKTKLIAYLAMLPLLSFVHVISAEEVEEVVVTGLLENHELGFVLSDDLVYGDWPKISQTKN